MLNSICLSLALSLAAGAAFATTPSYEILVTETEAQDALVIKGKVKAEDAGRVIGGIIEKVGAYLQRQGIEPAGAPFTRTFEFKDGELEFEAGFPVAGKVAAEGEIIVTELPAATVVTTVHTGPQETSEQAYEALHAWMAEHGKMPAGAPWESYEGETRMEIFFPFK